MARVMLKTVFVLAVILLMLIILVPAHLALDLILPSGRGGDRLLPGIIVMVFCLWAADRITSLIFWKTRLSDERWSIWDNRHRRRRRPG